MSGGGAAALVGPAGRSIALVRTCRTAVSSAQTEKASSSFSLVGVER